MLDLWIKDYKTGANKKVRDIDFDVAVIVCDAIFKAKSAAEKKNEKLKKYDLRYFRHDMTKAYEYVLNWVAKCGQEKTVVQLFTCKSTLTIDNLCRMAISQQVTPMSYGSS